MVESHRKLKIRKVTSNPEKKLTIPVTSKSKTDRLCKSRIREPIDYSHITYEITYYISVNIKNIILITNYFVLILNQLKLLLCLSLC